MISFKFKSTRFLRRSDGWKASCSVDVGDIFFANALCWNIETCGTWYVTGEIFFRQSWRVYIQEHRLIWPKTVSLSKECSFQLGDSWELFDWVLFVFCLERSLTPFHRIPSPLGLPAQGVVVGLGLTLTLVWKEVSGANCSSHRENGGKTLSDGGYPSCLTLLLEPFKRGYGPQ